jgi:hypothetical protein
VFQAQAFHATRCDLVEIKPPSVQLVLMWPSLAEAIYGGATDLNRLLAQVQIDCGACIYLGITRLASAACFSYSLGLLAVSHYLCLEQGAWYYYNWAWANKPLGE